MGGLCQGGKPQAAVLHSIKTAMADLMVKGLKHGFRIADNDATQVLEGVFHVTRQADAPAAGVGGLAQEMLQPFADRIETECGVKTSFNKLTLIFHFYFFT